MVSRLCPLESETMKKSLKRTSKLLLSARRASSFWELLRSRLISKSLRTSTLLQEPCRQNNNKYLMSSIASGADFSELSRFQCDLEFLQFLSNPDYVKFLIERGYFQDKRFLNYLQYLEYFRKSEYIRYVRYPVSLKMLEKLQDPQFMEQWKRDPVNFTNLVNGQIYAHYLYLGRDKPVQLVERPL